MRSPRDLPPASHPQWARFVQTLHQAGLAEELDLRSLPLRLGHRAERAPEPDGRCALLDDYYRGDGFAEVARRRAQADHYVAHRDGDATSARDVVAHLRAAAPELGPLALLHSGEGLALLSAGVRVPVSPEGVYAQGPAGSDRPVRRTVTVQALVAATNELLEIRSITRRFLPLARSDETEAYIGIERAAAEVIDAVDAFEAKLEHLLEFAGWRPRHPSSLDDLRAFSAWKRRHVGTGRSQRRVA